MLVVEHRGAHYAFRLTEERPEAYLGDGLRLARVATRVVGVVVRVSAPADALHRRGGPAWALEHDATPIGEANTDPD